MRALCECGESEPSDCAGTIFRCDGWFIAYGALYLAHARRCAVTEFRLEPLAVAAPFPSRRIYFMAQRKILEMFF